MNQSIDATYETKVCIIASNVLLWYDNSTGGKRLFAGIKIW
jgi:hypothetical protein